MAVKRIKESQDALRDEHLFRIDYMIGVMERARDMCKNIPSLAVVAADPLTAQLYEVYKAAKELDNVVSDLSGTF